MCATNSSISLAYLRPQHAFRRTSASNTCARWVSDMGQRAASHKYCKRSCIRSHNFYLHFIFFSIAHEFLFNIYCGPDNTTCHSGVSARVQQQQKRQRQRQRQKLPREDKCVGPDQCSAHLCFDASLAATSGIHTNAQQWASMGHTRNHTHMFQVASWTFRDLHVSVICIQTDNKKHKFISLFLRFLFLLLFQQRASKMLPTPLP